MQVQAIMQQDVVTAAPTLSLGQAQRLMHDKGIRHLPVVSGTHLVGLVTDRDIRDAIPSPATTLTKGEINYQMDTTPIRTCMTSKVVTVEPDEDTVQVARALLDRKFGCMPVVARGELVGIVTESDVLQGFLAAATPAGEIMQVKDYMHVAPITVTQDDLVNTAYQRMQGMRIRHLPVITEGQQIMGILTDRDVRQVHASDAPHLAVYELTTLLQKMSVKEVMTKPVVTVKSDNPVADAGQLLLAHKFGCLPVVRDDETLEGIITVTDLLRAYVEQHETATQVS